MEGCVVKCITKKLSVLIIYLADRCLCIPLIFYCCTICIDRKLDGRNSLIFINKTATLNVCDKTLGKSVDTYTSNLTII